MNGLHRAMSPLAAALLALPLGCAVGPDYAPPVTATASQFAAADEPALAAAAPETEWWALLSDATLDELMIEAVEANHDLRIAQANVGAARALLSQGRFDRYPTVTVAGSVARQQLSEATSAPGFAAADTLYDAGLDASWELDFFGRVRRSVEALAADYQAAVAVQRDVFVIVTAEVARTYVELRGAQYRLRVARENARNQLLTFELTQALLEGGRGTDLDIARAQAQLESTLAGIPPLEAEVARAIHRLGVLVGREPGALAAGLSTDMPLPSLPEIVSVGDPASLLRRRPDIQAAERSLAGATARIGLATADLFPRITVLGSAGYSALDRAAFGGADTERFSVGPFLSWTGFDLGRVRARILAAEFDADAELAAYERTVLTALEETENALVDFTRARQRQARLRVAAQASASAAELARIRYRNGADSFLTVLDAERRLLEAQDELAVSETATGRTLIAVYKALGGAWQAQPAQ